jgi:hypothetical protein
MAGTQSASDFIRSWQNDGRGGGGLAEKTWGRMRGFIPSAIIYANAILFDPDISIIVIGPVQFMIYLQILLLKTWCVQRSIRPQAD